MDYPTIAILVAATGAVLWQLARRGGTGRRRCKLRKRQSLLLPGRRYLYSRLSEAVGEDVTIQVAVPLKEVVTPAAPGGRGRVWWDKISSTPLDFVLCDAGTLQPQMVILVTEEEPTRRRGPRDQRRLARWLEQAKLPCLVLTDDREYEVDELEDAIVPRRAA